MDIFAILLKLLGKPLAGFLLKRYLGEIAGQIGDELISLAAERLKSSKLQHGAASRFEDLSRLIVERIEPLFEHAERKGDVSVEAVACELQTALTASGSAAFFVKGDLSAPRIIEAIQQQHPFPRGHFNEAETALYRRALSQTVHLLTQTASDLPRFQEAAASELFDRIRNMHDDLAARLDRLTRIDESAAIRKTGATYSEYENEYRKAVVRELDYLELFGAVLSDESRHHALSVGYITVSVESDDETEEAEDDGPVPVGSLFDRLKPGRVRLLIRGDAGSGKSTLMRWAAMTAAGYGRVEYDDGRRRFTGRPAKQLGADECGDPLTMKLAAEADHVAWHERVPFLVRLRDCQSGELPPIERFGARISPLIGEPPPGWIKRVLQDGRALLLIDGVDEVPQASRPGLLARIKSLAETYPGALCIVSTRPAPEEEAHLARAGFALSGISPMSPTDVDRFIDKWHEAVRQAAQRRESSVLAQLASDLKKELRDNPAIARLGTNPLLASMVCALHRDGAKRLPKEQHDLVETLCKILLERDRESGLDLSRFPEPYIKLTYLQKKRLVRELASRMIHTGESAMDRGEAREQIAAALRDMPGHGPEEARDVLFALIERSGMLGQVRPETFEFRHNTFKDYLGAEWLVNQANGVEDLAAMALDTGRQQVLLFAAALGERDRFATKLITRVLNDDPKTAPRASSRGQRRPPDPELHARRVLAIRMRSVAQLLDPDLTARIDAMAREIFPPRTFADAEALATLGDAVVPLLACNPSWNRRQTAASVRALRLMNSNAARRQLEGYLHHDAPSVLAELSRLFNPLTLPAVQAIMQQREPLPDSIRSQVTDLAPLAGLTGLQMLDLSSTRVSDLAPLSGLTGLKDLQLDGTNVIDLTPLSGLTGLQELCLTETGVNNLTALSGLTGLKTLYMDDTRVTDLAPLSGLTGLKSLYLSATRVTDVAPLAGLTGLQTLFLGNTGVTDLAPLAGLTGLQTLDLTSTGVIDLAPLAGLTGLRELDLRGTDVTDFAPLAGLTRLKRLWLSGDSKVDVSPLDGLVRAGLRIVRG